MLKAGGGGDVGVCVKERWRGEKREEEGRWRGGEFRISGRIWGTVGVGTFWAGEGRLEYEVAVCWIRAGGRRVWVLGEGCGSICSNTLDWPPPDRLCSLITHPGIGQLNATLNSILPTVPSDGNYKARFAPTMTRFNQFTRTQTALQLPALGV